MIWVADTGPVLHLAEANAVELLPLCCAGPHLEALLNDPKNDAPLL